MQRTAALLIGLACGLAHADEAAIRRVMEGKLGGAKIEGIQPGPIPGLYEVRYRAAEGMEIVYTDANADHIIVRGRVIDAKSNRDLTSERLAKLNAVSFASLPLDQAVKIQRGSGRHVLAMFSDPHCPYCIRFEKTLQEVDDVTIYVFMYPVIRPDLTDHSKAVWCSPDRAKAWLDLALNGKVPGVSAACDTPIEKNLELGRRLRVSGTPTLILPTGEKISGAIGAQDLREVLADATARAKR
ncbi:MAG TPA: DsbC family protein [Burkholderiales bacterium]|nr:DsbC family protein [Burkholderiales bacterium]